MGVVYLAISRTAGKGYVGKTKHTLDRRKLAHERKAAGGSKCYFHRALMKTSDALRGIKRSPETIAKRKKTCEDAGIYKRVSDSLRGIKRSEETRRRMSEAQKEAWKKRKNKEIES